MAWTPPEAGRAIVDAWRLTVLLSSGAYMLAPVPQVVIEVLEIKKACTYFGNNSRDPTFGQNKCFTKPPMRISLAYFKLFAHTVLVSLTPVKR